MKGVVAQLLNFLKKMGYYILEYAYICFFWKLRFFKVQLQKMKKCGIHKRMDKAHTELGAVVYGLYRQGAGDWQNMPSVREQLSQAEEVEADIFRVDRTIEEINAEYERKKAETKERFALKRSEIGKNDPESIDL